MNHFLGRTEIVRPNIKIYMLIELDNFGEKNDMVLVGKTFRLRENIKLPDIAYQLKSFIKEELMILILRFNLLTEAHGLALTKNLLQGVFVQDIITYIYHHGERMPTPKNIETSFAFIEQKEDYCQL